MKKIVLATIVALLALMPLALAEEIAVPAAPATVAPVPEVTDKAAADMSMPAVKARYTPDFKSMTRTVGTKILPAPKKTLTRANFKEVTTYVTNCRRDCTTTYRTCLRTCNAKRSTCPKLCKNANNKCYDTCSIATKR